MVSICILFFKRFFFLRNLKTQICSKDGIRVCTKCTAKVNKTQSNWSTSVITRYTHHGLVCFRLKNLCVCSVQPEFCSYSPS